MSCEKCPFKKECKIVLVGNPNVGKTSIFNMLSGKYEDVSNYPGTSVSIAKAKIHLGELIDTPGIYSFRNRSPVEEITKEYATKADIVINVVSALTLDRDLVLTKQLINIGLKLILVVNQVDEADKREIEIDYQKLSKTLNIDIVKTIATKNVGKNAIFQAIEKIHERFPCCLIQDINVQDVLDKCVLNNKNQLCLSQKIDGLLLKPIVGWLVAIAVLYGLFVVLGMFVSGYVVDNTIEFIDRWYTPIISEYVLHCFGNNLFSEIFIGEFGILTMEVKMIFGILLPLIIGFCVVMSLLEDSGYIPRLSVLTNKFFNFFGLNGNAIIPMLLGFGCGVMGTISTRILETDKERTIAIAIIGIAIPCAAQQGIIISLLASLNKISVWLLYITTMLIVILLSGKILSLFLKGKRANFIMELTPLRFPSFKNCYKKTVRRVTLFLSESLVIFTISSVIITLLHNFGFLHWLQLNLSTIVEDLLHLPREFSDIFVMGVIRKDFASVGVFNMAKEILTNSQIIVATVVISLFVPCINALIVILKEKGYKMALALYGGTFAISVIVGSILTRILEFCEV
jgi:ferrous iron transport protein B